MRLSTFVCIASCSSVAAFVPISTPPSHSIVQLEAENSSRRKAFGAIGASLGAALLFPQVSSAGSINPALATFKGRKKGKGQFIPGKGMHLNEEYDRLMAITNPALQTFKGGKKGKGQFIPGKGMHLNGEEYDRLMAINNPALQTFKARKPTKGQFIPGKGMHMNEEYDHLMAITNPALQTFKGRKQGKGQFIPGKGLHLKEEYM